MLENKNIPCAIVAPVAIYKRCNDDVDIGWHAQEFGDTALHCAYRSKATEVIETLLAAGADSEVSYKRPCLLVALSLTEPRIAS